MTATKLFSIRI